MSSNTTSSAEYGKNGKMGFLLLDIMHRVGKHQSSFEIQKRYGWSKQRFFYWMKKLKNLGFINEVSKQFGIYELSQDGKNFYIRYVSSLQPNGIRLHNVSYSYPIISSATLEVEKEWELRGLNYQLERRSNCTIVSNGRSIIVNVSSLFGKDAFQLLADSQQIAENVINSLRNRGWQIDPGKLCRKPEFAIIDPIAQKIGEQLQLSTSEGKIDKSMGVGEIEFFSPAMAQAYIEMPKHIIEQTLIMDKLAEQIKLHLEVMQEMKETMKAIRESLKK